MARLVEARADAAVDAQHALFEHQARLALEFRQLFTLRAHTYDSPSCARSACSARK